MALTSSSRQALQRVQRAQKALARAEAELREVRRRRRIGCSCGKRHAIRDLVLLVTHWKASYDDYWKEGEWQFRCPVTNMLNRFMFDDWGLEYGQRSTAGIAGEPTFKALYRGLFKSSEDVHDKENEAFHNNFYVDQHREAFELPAKVERK